MANRRIYNGTRRTIVLTPTANIKIIIPAHDGSVGINEEQYKALNKSGLFKAMRERRQLAFKPIMLSEGNQKTSFKEIPQSLRPPEDNRVNENISQEIKIG